MLFLTCQATAAVRNRAAMRMLADCAQVLKLVEMGFDETAAAAALSDANGDENLALERLLGG